MSLLCLSHYYVYIRHYYFFQIPPEIKKRMTLAGTMMIGYQPLKDHVNFFRMIVISSAVTHADMDFVLDEIERLGKDL